MTANAIAVIPARGGSKRIPRKNIRSFCGAPIIHWPLRAARESGVFARIIVSTDDPEIAEVAQDGGAEIPFMRDADLADDMTGTKDVIRDAVERLGLSAHTPVCCLYPTAAFIRGADLLAGLEKLIACNGPEWVFTVAPYDTPVRRAYELCGDRVVPIHPASMSMRSQDLPPAFFDAGQFYWAKAGTWKNPKAEIWDGASPVFLDSKRVVDIDTPKDWTQAERIFQEVRETGQ